MDSDPYYDTFSFCSRNDLEGLQLVRKSLRSTIDSRSKVLPLRPIDLVKMDTWDEPGKIQVFVKELEDDDDDDVPEPDFEASIHDGDFAETFRRLQNTCLKEFKVGIRDGPFLRFWKAREDAAFTVVRIDFGLPGDTDYDVLDSVVNHLRPKTTQVDVKNSDGEYLNLLARDSLLRNLQTCYLLAWRDAFPPPAFFLEEPGYPKYELWRHRNVNASAGIDGFIESFVRGGCSNKKLESVCIGWDEFSDFPSPMPKQLCKPTKTDKPLPKAEMLMRQIPAVHRVSQCEMHTFVNTEQWKRMEVFKWTVEYDPVVGVSGHDEAHILQCRVENL